MRLISSAVIVLIWTSIPAMAENLLPDLKPEAAKAYCENKWTKRDELDVDMYDYCMSSQLDGYSKALALSHQYMHLPWMEQLLSMLFEKWTKRDAIQYDMIAYTLNEEIEGYLDVEYALKKGDVTPDLVEHCEGKWAPQYSMVSYCLDL